MFDSVSVQGYHARLWELGFIRQHRNNQVCDACLIVAGKFSVLFFLCILVACFSFVTRVMSPPIWTSKTTLTLGTQ